MKLINGDMEFEIEIATPSMYIEDLLGAVEEEKQTEADKLDKEYIKAMDENGKIKELRKVNGVPMELLPVVYARKRKEFEFKYLVKQLQVIILKKKLTEEQTKLIDLECNSIFWKMQNKKEMRETADEFFRDLAV
jgi:hypothetical protein